MAFDVDAFRAAHRPWSLTIQGRTFGARHVSAMQVQEYERRFSTAATESARLTAVTWLLRRAFPWRVSYLVRGDPVTLVLGLEPAARAEALMDFFACLRTGTSPRNPQRPTSGTSSPTRTRITTHVRL